MESLFKNGSYCTKPYQSVFLYNNLMTIHDLSCDFQSGELDHEWVCPNDSLTRIISAFFKTVK